MPTMRVYTLMGADGRPYRSSVPGTLGGYRRGRLYGRLDCRSALRAISVGDYIRHRVFFLDEATAIAAGYRPCAVCLPETYARWKAARDHDMHPVNGYTRPRSPLIRPADVTAYGELPAPIPYAGPELTSLLGLLTAPRSRIETVTVGHSRDDASRATVDAFTEAWQAVGRTVLAVVDWPEEAASWLRAAQRFTRGTPDAWVVAAAPLGWVQMSRRLRHSTGWDPNRTFGFASLAEPCITALAGQGTLDGLRGATGDGGIWKVESDRLTVCPPENEGTVA
ncbi:hypothetical protein ACFHYQ_05420 [Sphaerimonospora cavernae]|uniref:Metal binding Ada-like protein n=1 Tax=Sphaerimonospora cavernae TaxID=1740611 RepID=A0ABV6TZU1_9ACTN